MAEGEIHGPAEKKKRSKYVISGPCPKKERRPPGRGLGRRIENAKKKDLASQCPSGKEGGKGCGFFRWKKGGGTGAGGKRKVGSKEKKKSTATENNSSSPMSKKEGEKAKSYNGNRNKDKRGSDALHKEREMPGNAPHSRRKRVGP